MKKITDFSAYGSPAFKKRDKGLNHYPFFSEYKKIKSVALHIPSHEIHKLKNPDSVQHLDSIDTTLLKKELKKIIAFYKKNNINVIVIKTEKYETPPPNLCFVRDLFWNSPNGFILSRMGSSIRAPEEFFMQRTLANYFFKIHHSISSPSILEGADLLWLSSTKVLIGIGNRTNLKAYNELRKLFPKLTFIKVKLPKKVQHLLGMIQFVDKKKALVRTEIAPKELMAILKKEKCKIICIPESDEVINKQGMNTVTMAPNQIIMPNDCPTLKKIYEDHKIKVVGTFSITELRKAAGGLACLTGILERED